MQVFVHFWKKWCRITQLDRYLLKYYLRTIFFSCFIFIFISVPIDYSERLNAFLENKELTKKQIILEYFLPFIPSLMAILANIIVFISVIFFTSRLASRSEFIAIFAAGISLKRILRPYLVGSILIAITLFWANQSALPKINSIKGDFTLKYIDHVTDDLSYDHYYTALDSQSILGIRNYDAGIGKGTNILIEHYDGNKIDRITRAESIAWDATTQQWTLYKITERTINGYKEKIKTIPSRTLPLFIKPEDFNQDFYLKERLTNAQLQNKIALESIKGSDRVVFLEVEYYQRAARPISIIILSCIGAILAVRKIRGGSGLHLALGVLISVAYILLERFSSVLATNASFNPFLAVWFPNVLFGSIAYYLYVRAPK